MTPGPTTTEVTMMELTLTVAMLAMKVWEIGDDPQPINPLIGR